jgi:hypothetical protein
MQGQQYLTGWEIVSHQRVQRLHHHLLTQVVGCGTWLSAKIWTCRAPKIGANETDLRSRTQPGWCSGGGRPAGTDSRKTDARSKTPTEEQKIESSKLGIV